MSNGTNGKANNGNNGNELRPNYLTRIEVLGQSIANIAPSATPALVIPLVFATAGNGTWLAYLFGLVAIALVAVSLNQFTSRSASPGSLYAYIAKGLGPSAGVISGWALLLAYILCAGSVLLGFINYANVLLAYGGIVISPYVIGLVGALIAWFIAYKDVKLSAKIMLSCEGVAILLITALAVVVLANHGLHIDHAQLALKGVSPYAIRIGLVLAFFSFTGFESAASLGDEAKEPLRTIPKAIIFSTIFVGIFFVLLSYTQVLGFIGSTTTLDQSAAPLSALATMNGVAFFGPLISIGALISFWSCFLACINSSGRILFLMGRHAVFHSSMGDAHEFNKTPHIALIVSAILAAVIPLVLLALKTGGYFDIYGYIGTIATFGFLLCYLLIAIAAPVYLYREKELKAGHIVLAIVTVVAVAIPLAGSVYPLPAAPYNLFPFIFVAWLVVGGLWFLMKKFQSPDFTADIDSELESVHQKFREMRGSGDGI